MPDGVYVVMERAERGDGVCHHLALFREIFGILERLGVGCAPWKVVWRVFALHVGVWAPNVHPFNINE